MVDLYLVKRADGLFEAYDDESMVEMAKYKDNELIMVKAVKATRTIKMNSCLHKYCSILAGHLNGAGYSVLKVLRKDAEIPWSGDSVKELLWRPVQIAMTGKESTTEATNVEYSDTHKVLDRHLSEKFGVGASWPNRFGD